MALTPRARALMKAAAVVTEEAQRTNDTRLLIEAETIKCQLTAELERVPGMALPPGKRHDKSWRW